MEKYRIIYPLPSDRWEEYKNLKILSLTQNPVAFGRNKIEFIHEKRWTPEEWVKDLRDPGSKILFAENESGELVGMIKMSVCLNLRISKKRECRISHFFVSKEYRNRGFGLVLFREAIAICKNWNAGKITLNVVISQKKAYQMYRKFGFEIDSYQFSFKLFVFYINMSLKI